MEKNRKLLGKFNIVDLLVVILVLAMVIGVALKLTGHLDPVETGAGGTDIVYTAEVGAIQPEIYEEIKNFIQAAKDAGLPGDQLMANGEKLNGYITDVEATPHVNYFYDEQGRGVTSSEADGRLDLIFTIQAHAENSVTTKVGTQEVRVGKSHIVKTVHFELNGTIYTCRWANEG